VHDVPLPRSYPKCARDTSECNSTRGESDYFGGCDTSIMAERGLVLRHCAGEGGSSIGVKDLSNDVCHERRNTAGHDGRSDGGRRSENTSLREMSENRRWREGWGPWDGNDGEHGSASCCCFSMSSVSPRTVVCKDVRVVSTDCFLIDEVAGVCVIS